MFLVGSLDSDAELSDNSLCSYDTGGKRRSQYADQPVLQGDRGARRPGSCKKAALPELRQCGLGSCFGSGVTQLAGGLQLAAVFCLRVERGQEEQRVDSRDDGQDDQDAGIGARGVEAEVHQRRRQQPADRQHGHHDAERRIVGAAAEDLRGQQRLDEPVEADGHRQQHDRDDGLPLVFHECQHHDAGEGEQDTEQRGEVRAEAVGQHAEDDLVDGQQHQHQAQHLRRVGRGEPAVLQVGHDGAVDAVGGDGREHHADHGQVEIRLFQQHLHGHARPGGGDLFGLMRRAAALGVVIGLQAKFLRPVLHDEEDHDRHGREQPRRKQQRRAPAGRFHNAREHQAQSRTADAAGRHDDAGHHTQVALEPVAEHPGQGRRTDKIFADAVDQRAEKQRDGIARRAVAHIGHGDEQDQQDRRPPVAETLIEPAHKQIAEGGRDIADRDPHGIQAARDAEARRNGDDVQRVEVVRQTDDHADREKGSDDNAQIAKLPVSLFHDAFPPQNHSIFPNSSQCSCHAVS